MWFFRKASTNTQYSILGAAGWVVLALLGASSWYGISVYRATTAGPDQEELSRPVLKNASPVVVSPSASLKAFQTRWTGAQVVYSESCLTLVGSAGVAPSGERPKPEPSTRQAPPLVEMEELGSATLADRSVPLPKAELQTSHHRRHDMLARLVGVDGEERLFNPQAVLIKWRDRELVHAIRVPAQMELDALQRLQARQDVAFASLDVLHTRQGGAGTWVPNDPNLTSQWHHGTLHSTAAWAYNRGVASIRIAIVDTPFQMDHPDLKANTEFGWDAVTDQVVTNSDGLDHSTLSAGFAAAVINNSTGIAGMGNCHILPINIEGFTSEMYNAVIWSSEHDVRLVNISWDGADDPTLNDAGAQLRRKCGGMLLMAGVNGQGYLDYPAWPNITCVSMTDASDSVRSFHGPHIDFAAPGWGVYSTTINSGYDVDSGTSFATPILAGMIGVVFSINPRLTPEDVEQLLKETSVDFGTAGWDSYYGWGRVDFGRLVEAAANLTVSRATITLNPIQASGDQWLISATSDTPLTCFLESMTGLGGSPEWIVINDALLKTNGATLEWTLPRHQDTHGVYRIRGSLP